MRKFWVVFVEGGDPPKHLAASALPAPINLNKFGTTQHFTRPEAEAEAERLVLKTGCPVVILEAVSWAKPPNVIVVWSTDFEYQLERN